jgi:hypothetical protein
LFLLLFVERYFTSTWDLQSSGSPFCQRQAIVAGWQELAASFFSTVPGHLLCKLAKKRSGVLSLLVVLHTNDSFFFFHSHFWMAHTSISIIPRNTSSRFPQMWWKKKKNTASSSITKT